MKLMINMTESMARIAEQNARFQMLLVMTFVLCMAMLIKEVVYLGRFIKRTFGMTQNGADPTDLATYGHVQKLFNAHESNSIARLAEHKNETARSLNAHFTAMQEEQRQARKKANATLIILRDLRAFMIYQRKPGDEKGTAMIAAAIDEENEI